MALFLQFIIQSVYQVTLVTLVQVYQAGVVSLAFLVYQAGLVYLVTPVGLVYLVTPVGLVFQDTLVFLVGQAFLAGAVSVVGLA